MDLHEAIYGRRAVRAYRADRVTQEVVRELLQAAIQAPSAMNAQPWRFSVIQDPGKLKEYSTRAKNMLLELAVSNSKARSYEPLLRDENFNIFYDAATLIVISVEEDGPYAQADGWLAAANLMLAAYGTGLGTCCIGFAIPLLNTHEVKSELGIPPGGVAVAPLIVGFPSSSPPPVPRADPVILAWR